MNRLPYAFSLPYRWLCFWLVSFFAVGGVVGQSVTFQGYTGANLRFTATLNYSVVSELHTDGRTKSILTWSIDWNKADSTYSGGLGFTTTAPGSNGVTGAWPSSLTIPSGTPSGVISGVAIAYFPANLNPPLPRSGTITPSASGVTTGTASPIVWPAIGQQTQTVTVTPTTATIRVGQGANLTASGGRNGYNWSATNGGMLASDGAEAVFSASTPATYIVQVVSPAGGGYSESNYATATITVTPAEKLKISLPKNDTGRPVEYIVEVGGQIIETLVQSIGQAARTVEVTLPPSIPSGTPATVYSRTLGISQDPDTGSWTVVPGAVVTGPSVTVNPTTDPANVPATEAPQPNVPKAPDPVSGDQGGKNVWTAPPGSGGLTDAAYKEGIDRTTSALEKINKTLEDRIGSGSGGGGSGGDGEGDGNVSDSGTHERLDSIGEKMDAEAAKHQAAQDANPAPGVAAGQGSSAAANEASKIRQFGAVATPSGGAAPVLSIAMPAAFGGKVVDLNPFSAERFASICAWHRKACEWLAIVLFGVWCSVEAGKMVQGVNTARQAKGNAVFGGTGGQATALIAAAAITVVVAVALVAIGTFATTNLGGGTLLSVIDDDPFSGLFGGAVWMLDQLFPLGAIVACVAGRLVWQAAAQSAYVAAAAAIRFIVP